MSATSWIKRASGLILPRFADWYPCCCEKKCYQTCIGGQYQYTVDLLGGGWTNLGCNACEDIAGEFVVTCFEDLGQPKPPYWEYQVEEWCFQGISPYTLTIGLVWDVYAAGVHFYTLIIQLTGGVGPGTSIATYNSPETTSESCHSEADGEGKIEMTKQSESHSSGVGFSDPCEGSLPDPVYLLTG